MGYIDPNIDYDKVDNLANNAPNNLICKQLEFLFINLNLQPDPSGLYCGEWIQTSSYGSPYKMSVSNYIVSNNDVKDLAKVFHGSFERSADKLDVIEKRGNFAKDWCDYLTSLGK